MYTKRQVIKNVLGLAEKRLKLINLAGKVRLPIDIAVTRKRAQNACDSP